MSKKKIDVGGEIEHVRSFGGPFARVAQLAELGMRVQDAVRATGGLPRVREKGKAPTTRRPRQPREQRPAADGAAAS